ncbi:MAG: (E)-4-hydroxy-3-methylbut-2-enyl-diphosphate synthase [Thermoguttaceae bacterium]|nr:(E)-4-hydroxy-3-methylbut-2-enyl-diphosphate synthase [Thermoguttaceae bacterium]MDW8078065.1 (E)-4-hydroxy-3-methylbut-2-enyl-diphosphate synthase [Thermoguttaceae bacterium]
MATINRRQTREVRVGRVTIGGLHPIVLQSMCATHTWDAEATIAQCRQLAEAGAQIVRVAVDSDRDVKALPAIADQCPVPLSVDLQENYRLAAQVAGWVRKIRYNPGHLHHVDRHVTWEDKVRWLADIAGQHGCALRVGVNCGSIDPALKERYPDADSVDLMVLSACLHCELLEKIGFTNYVVSLKDSEPAKVVAANRRFAKEWPTVPLHLGLTEAGLPPEGVLKTKRALLPLLREGIGETIRVSLTLPAERKHEEILAAKEILAELENAGEFEPLRDEISEEVRLDLVSCPSCSRVENTAFVALAEKVRELTAYARAYPFKIAVMGCRVNGPGETDDADIGLWCGANFVNLKCRGQLVGRFGYDEVLAEVKRRLDILISEYNARQQRQVAHQEQPA